MIEKFFQKIQRKYRINNKRLAEKAQISEKQISRFRTGKGNLSTKNLWELILALEDISPEARINLGLSIGGCSSTDGKINWEKLIDIISNEDIELILKAIGKKINKS